MCAGSHLANRELYTAFIRSITAFTIHPPQDSTDLPILDALECNSIPTALTTEPKPFKIRFKVRDPVLLQQWIAESQERTKDLRPMGDVGSYGGPGNKLLDCLNMERQRCSATLLLCKIFPGRKISFCLTSCSQWSKVVCSCMQLSSSSFNSYICFLRSI